VVSRIDNAPIPPATALFLDNEITFHKENISFLEDAASTPYALLHATPSYNAAQRLK
jgi:hypothetical protein